MPNNLHVSPGTLVGISRILKEVDSLAQMDLFDQIVVVGRASGGLSPSEDVTSKVVLVRINAMGAGNRDAGILGRLLWFAAWSLRVVWRFKRADISCVNAHSLSVLPVSWILAKTNRAKLVYDTHELETETATLRGSRKKLAKIVERAFIAQCDLVITVTTGIAEWYSERYSDVNPLVVRNVPASSAACSSNVQLRAELGVPADALLFIHTGHLTTARSIPAILRAFSQREVRHHVVFLGEGTLEDVVQLASDRHETIHLRSPVDHRQVIAWVAAADVGLCLIEQTSESYEYALPNKLFESLLAEVALVTTYLVEAHRLLGDEYLDLCIDDVSRDLNELVRTFGPEQLQTHRTVDRSWKVPDWSGEAARMNAAYLALRIRET